MYNENSNGLFVTFLHLFSCCCFFASVIIFNNKDKIKNGYIVIIKIVINIMKGSGGNNAPLLGDFALEPSENFNLIFFNELTLLNLSNSNGCSSVIFCPITINHTSF